MPFLIDVQELKSGLIIFRRADVQHRNWYCRIRVPNADRYKTVSLKTSDIHEAKKQAFHHDADMLFRVRHEVPIFNKTFAQVAKEYADFQKRVAETGQITVNRWKIVDSYIRLHLIPYVGNVQITQIGQDKWTDYIHWRKTEGGNKPPKKKRPENLPQDNQPRPAKDGAIRQELMTFRAIMSFAARKQYIRESQVPKDKLPTDRARRDAFTPQEYRKLHTNARAWIKKGRNDFNIFYRTMAYNFMLIMANTGMRPPEARDLRWRDVDIRTDKHGRQFVCLNVRGKGKFRELVAASNVASYLDRVRELRETTSRKLRKEGKADDSVSKAKNRRDMAIDAPTPDDFVFTAYEGKQAVTLYGSLIGDLLETSTLLFGPSGSRRSTYCFRHTYATFRLMEGVDVYFLAKQMGTSVQMIEHYYGHITPAKNAERILQGIPGWEPVANASGETDSGVHAAGAGRATAVKGTRGKVQAVEKGASSSMRPATASSRKEARTPAKRLGSVARQHGRRVRRRAIYAPTTARTEPA